MKNVLSVTPDQELDARQRESLSFVVKEDVVDKKMLDIGCGFGWNELAFLRRKVGQIIGIEITEGDLETARKNIRHKNVQFYVGSAIELPFSKTTFDTVVSWEVLEHIPKNTEMKMFSEVNRVLKPGGVFYLSTPFDSWLSKILDPAWWLIGHRHYSREQLAAYAAKQGFELLEVRQKGRLWTLLNMDNMYLAKWLFRRQPFFQNFFTRKQEAEYRQAGGYATIFAKFRKVG